MDRERRGRDLDLIELSNISKVYAQGDQPILVLENVSLSVTTGDFIAIVGPSGSGKSTLMNMIGLLDVPSSGSYILDGVATEKLSDNQMAELRNKKIGFIFQQFNLLPKLTAVENVELPMIYAGYDKKRRREIAHATLESLGMGKHGHHRPNQLSGGQQQRVAIGRALAISPSLMLADEPTGALDSKTGIEVLDLLMELNEKGNTIVLITHDANIAKHAKRVISIRDGRIVGDERMISLNYRPIGVKV
ncbi:MAG: ABC transporter ATP-binding protein [Gorillibacterium sp.]|nr:ABC transporter ATP-binding protein [Gorillibacterium sp.]